MKDFDIFLDYNNDLNKMQEILNSAKSDGFVMANDFNKEIPSAEELYAEFRKYNHGNSKMILHFFHNNITNRKEISYGTRSIFQSYPQYKNIKIIKIPSFITT